MISDTNLFIPGSNHRTGLAGLMAVMRDPLTGWSKDLFRGEAVQYELASIKTIDTACPDDVAIVLKDERDCFRRAPMARLMLTPAMGDGLIIADGKSWRKQRSLAAPAFRQRELDALVPTFDRIGRKLVEGLNRGGDQQLLPPLTAATLDIIVQSLFGDIAIDRKRVATDVAIFLEVAGKPHPFDVLGLPSIIPRPGRLTSNAAAKRMRAVSTGVLREARKHSTGGGVMLEQLLAASDPESGEALSDEQIVDAIMTFVGAGHETTSVALSWTLWLLAHRPELQEQLQLEGASLTDPLVADDLSNLDLHTRVVQEAMRLFPPVALVMRQVTKSVTVSNTRLRKGDFVNLITIALHRSPDHWPEPDKFDPDRFLPDAVKARHRFAYLPFGGGATMCIGWKLALMEATVLLHRIVQAFQVDVISGAPQPYPEVRITMRPKNGMPLRLTPRHPLS